MFKFFGKGRESGEFTGNEGLFPGQPLMDPQTRSILNRGMDKLSAAVGGLFNAVKNPRALANALFTKQNITEIAVSAGIMGTAKATVLAASAVLSAPVAAVYAATVVTGGVVGGLMRTWKDWRKSRNDASQAITDHLARHTPISDEFSRKARQGYVSFAWENKSLVGKNVLKSAFTAAVGGAIGVAAHSAFDAVSNLNLFASAPDAVTPVTSPSPTEAIRLSPVLENTLNTGNIDVPVPAASVEPVSPGPTVAVSDAAEKIRTDEFAAKIKDVIDAPSNEAATPETPPSLTTKELNEKFLASLDGDDTKITIDPAIFDDDTVTSGTPATEPAVPVPPPAVETPTPEAPAAPQILPQGVAAQCAMGDDNQIVNCIARADGKIGEGEKLRMMFGEKSAPVAVDFQNGGNSTTVPKFIDRLRGFAPFESWRTSPQAAAAQLK